MSDVEVNDVIHDTYVGESVRAYFDPGHRWYFLSEQKVEETIMFRNTDSRGMQYPWLVLGLVG
ncbi:unnamed protein product [Clonostachys solani]|uniref:Uncharacterized protein n=1 Tax=Clonostachys solani TaxID=160281 RepID=A0A9P0EPS8_9HYPO|nr:unnamed protein product [Clonostachys solani]